MFRTLKAEMVRKGFKIRELSEVVGMKHGTLSRKLRGETDFTLSECTKIKSALEVGMSIDELFETR